MVSIGKGTKAEEAGLMPGDRLEARKRLESSTVGCAGIRCDTWGVRYVEFVSNLTLS